MEFLGIGGWELAAILIILLIVAGPKRMIAWSYTLGKYMAVFRSMWAETATQLQREFHSAGVDIELPKEPPTRASLNKMVMDTVTKASAPVTAPLQETQKSVKELMGSAAIHTPAKPADAPPAPAPASNGAASAPGTQDSSPSAPPAEASSSASEDASFGAWGSGKP